jgi:hypothetical protein
MPAATFVSESAWAEDSPSPVATGEGRRMRGGFSAGGGFLVRDPHRHRPRPAPRARRPHGLPGTCPAPSAHPEAVLVDPADPREAVQPRDHLFNAWLLNRQVRQGITRSHRRHQVARRRHRPVKLEPAAAPRARTSRAPGTTNRPGGSGASSERSTTSEHSRRTAPEPRQRPIVHHLPVVDQHDPVAQARHVRHVMRR